MWSLNIMSLLMGCQVEKSTEVLDTGTPPIESMAMEFTFSIAILADPHISGTPEHSQRLQEAIAWINEHQESRQIEVVPVLGDVGWGVGLSEAKGLLDQLQMPYVPLIGDNEVHFGDEQSFGDIFAPQFERLRSDFEDWNFNGDAVWNPEEQKDSYFYNSAFTHKGLRFISLDWAARTSSALLSELGYLHNFENASWPFFEEEMHALQNQGKQSSIFLSHIPMFIGSFDLAQMTAIEGLTTVYDEQIYANFAGHLHVNVEDLNLDRGYDVFVTDATWDDVITVRMIDVYSNGVDFAFEQELVEFEVSQ